MCRMRSLLEDFQRYQGPLRQRLRAALTAPGFWAVATFRLQQASFRLPLPLRVPAKLVLRPLAFATQLVTGVELQSGAQIGPGLYVGHWGGIVVSSKARIGARCNLSQGVTLGVAKGPDGRWGAPVLGERVYVGPGAKIFGPIRIGNDVAIGANAVVNRDVPDGVSVGGVPAKVISHHGSRGLIELGAEEQGGGSTPQAGRNVILPGPARSTLEPQSEPRTEERRAL